MIGKIIASFLFPVALFLAYFQNAWSWAFLTAGLLAMWLINWPVKKAIPGVYEGLPLRARVNGYSVYTRAEVYSNLDTTTLFMDGSEVTLSHLYRLRVSANTEMFILDKWGQEVFPGKAK